MLSYSPEKGSRRTSTTMPSDDTEIIECVNDNYTRSVTLDGDMNIFFGHHSYTLGKTKLSIPLPLITNDVVDLDSDGASTIKISRISTRGTEHHTGTYKVLVVRVVDANGNEPTISLADLGTKTFDDAHNLVSAEL